MGSLLGADKAFLDNYLQEITRKVIHTTAMGHTAIILQKFIALDPAVQRTLIKQVLNKEFPQEKSLGAVHYEDIRKLLIREISSTNLQVNEHIILRIENGQGVFLSNNEINIPSGQWPAIEQSLQVPLNKRVYALGENWQLVVDKVDADSVGDSFRTNTDLFRAYLDAEKLEPVLTLRAWQAGDRFRPLGMHGRHVKLSDFWINQKMPRRAKKFWPLVFSAGELVWIPGFQVSEIAKINAETREIIVLRVVKKEN
jgi:tRNA(Ile)-lysidine synthase